MPTTSKNSASAVLPPSKKDFDHEKKVLSDQSAMGSGTPPEGWAILGSTGRPITPTALAQTGPVRQMQVGSPMGEARVVTPRSGTSVPGFGGATLAPKQISSQTASERDMPTDTQHSVIEMSSDDELESDSVEHSNTKKIEHEDHIRSALDALLREALDYAKQERESRSKRGNTKPSDKTHVDYEKKYKRFLEVFNGARGGYEQKVRAALSPYAGSKNSFKSMRAAAKYMLKRTMSGVVERFGTNTVPLRLDNELSQELTHLLKQQLTILRALDSVDRTEILQSDLRHTVRVRSKRHQLPLLKDGWQEKFLQINERSETYCDAGVLMRFCGLREAEFAAGVAIEYQQQSVIVKITGAKVRPGIAGQPWRVMKLEAEKLPKRFLEKLKASSSMKVTVSPEAFRQHVKRTTDEVIGRVMDGDRRVWLTPYMFRHALVTDLRYSGWEEHEIAAVLGELAEDTTKVYGRRVRAGSKRPSSVAVVRGSTQTALLVRASKKNSGYSRKVKDRKALRS